MEGIDMIPLSVPYLDGNELKYIKECMDTKHISTSGSFVEKFEHKFIEYIGLKYCLATVSGTAALCLALLVIGLKAGDEVIVPSFTFVATVNSIIYCNANPVFIDINEDSLTIDPYKIREMITAKTKAILVVHVYGIPANMDEICRIAKEYGLYVIEDATESLGSEYNGLRTGTIGDIGCFSFNGNKIISTGAGGMLVTNNSFFFERAKLLSSQAKMLLPNNSYYYEDIGYNYRLPAILGALGIGQLENLNLIIDKKRSVAYTYSKLLSGFDKLILPNEGREIRSNYWLYYIVLKNIDNVEQIRNNLMSFLKDNNIETRPFFKPIHAMHPYKNFRHTSMSITDSASKRGLNLPTSPSLTTQEIEYIVNTIINFSEYQ